MKKGMHGLLILAAAGLIVSAFSGVRAEDSTYFVHNPFPAEKEAGVVINDHYAYCIDEHNPWPDRDDIAYSETALDENVQGNKEKLMRALEAGYPLDALGLSSRQTELTDQERGTATQYVVWSILGSYTYTDAALSYGGAYIRALYEYAMKGTVDGKTPDSVSDAVTASISALTKNADGTWSGQLTFVSGKPASLAITAIPDGMTLKNGETALSADDTVLSTDTLTVTVSSSYQSGSALFSYQKTSKAGGDITLYSTSAETGGKAYQRMIGYQFSTEQAAVSVSTAIPSVSTPASSQSPSPSASSSPAPTATASAPAAASTPAVYSGNGPEYFEIPDTADRSR